MLNIIAKSAFLYEVAACLQDYCILKNAKLSFIFDNSRSVLAVHITTPTPTTLKQFHFVGARVILRWIFRQ